jgi:hypothetical protein
MSDEKRLESIDMPEVILDPRKTIGPRDSGGIR